MVIGYKDFFPAVVKSGFFSTEHEELPSTVARANDWIAQSRVRLINVETVVLPNVRQEEDASQVGICTSGDLSSYWFQVVRIWYEVGEPKA
jgi:hypothetical protein